MIDFSQLDRTIHEKGRLSIMTLLASRAEPWPFQDLKAQLDMSDGNLITHLRTLEKADFISGEKLTGDGRPQTLYSLTSSRARGLRRLSRRARTNSRPRQIIPLAPNWLCDTKLIPHETIPSQLRALKLCTTKLKAL